MRGEGRVRIKKSGEPSSKKKRGPGRILKEKGGVYAAKEIGFPLRGGRTKGKRKKGRGRGSPAKQQRPAASSPHAGKKFPLHLNRRKRAPGPLGQKKVKNPGCENPSVEADVAGKEKRIPRGTLERPSIHWEGKKGSRPHKGHVPAAKPEP